MLSQHVFLPTGVSFTVDIPIYAVEDTVRPQQLALWTHEGLMHAVVHIPTGMKWKTPWDLTSLGS